VKALFETHVLGFEPGIVRVADRKGRRPSPPRKSLPSPAIIPTSRSCAASASFWTPETNKPSLDPKTLQSNVPGIYLAGVVIGGNHTSEIFIENGRFHGQANRRRLAGAPSAGGRAMITHPSECTSEDGEPFAESNR